MVRRSRQDSLATRELILDTAEVLFARNGVSRTCLDEIAKAAGLTRGAIYGHFKDKADMFNAMMQRVLLPMEQDMTRDDDREIANPLSHVRESFLNALRKTVNDPQVRRVFEIATHKVEYVDELRAVRERHLAVRDNMMTHVRQRLTEAELRGLLGRGVPARTAAFGLHALIDGLIQNWMLDPKAFDLVRTGKQVIDTYLAGLSVPKK